MGRAPCCEKSGLKKGPWTPEEDQKLIDYISKNGYGNWRTLPKNAGLERCGKSCRLRWTNYLRPDIKRGRFSFEEEETIIQLHSILGNKWSAIAARLPGRTDNEIKNYWNTHIRKRLLRMGIDPVTHSPRLDLLDLSSILYHNNQSSSRLMGMTHPDLLRIATSMMSQPENLVTSNFYSQTQVDSFDPTRLIQDQCYYTQHELDHESLSQIQALQHQVAEYGSTPFQNDVPLSNLSPDSGYVPVPFTEFYNVADQTQNQNNSVFFGQAEGQILSMNNLVMSTPSSSRNSNVYMNSSCTSTEDEKENDNNRINFCNNDLVKMMKYEMPEIFDVNEFIC